MKVCREMEKRVMPFIEGRLREGDLAESEDGGLEFVNVLQQVDRVAGLQGEFFPAGGGEEALLQELLCCVVDLLWVKSLPFLCGEGDGESACSLIFVDGLEVLYFPFLTS